MNERIQKIGIGTAQFGLPYGISNQSGKTTQNEVSKILEIGRKNGIQIVDTASAYGNTEKILGLNDLSSFKIVSKYMPPDAGNTISHQLSKSLADLSVNSLYGYLAHRPKNLADHLYQWDELQTLKENKKIQKIGFSLNRVSELEELLEKGIEPDIIQVPYNYFDQRFKDLMILLNRSGCEIHSRSVFLQGLFFMDINKLDRYFSELFPSLEHLQKEVKNLPVALLKFVLNKSYIDKVIIGVENSGQFIQNLNFNQSSQTLPVLKEKFSENLLIPSNWPN